MSVSMELDKDTEEILQMSSIVDYICNNCNKLVNTKEASEKAKDNFLCEECYQEAITTIENIIGSEIVSKADPTVRKTIYQRKLDQVIADMEEIQNYDCREAYAFYQIRSLLMELRKEQQGGYMSISYMQEKCENLLSQAKSIAREKGMYNHE